MRKALTAAFVLAASLLLPVPAYAGTDPTISNGIYAQGIDLSGMTRDQAVSAIDSWFETFAAQKYIITCADGSQTTSSLSDWGMTWDSSGAVDTAMNYSAGGDLIRIYKSKQDLSYCNVYLDVDYSLNQDKITDFLKEAAETHDTQPQNATLVHDGDSFTVSQEQQGQTTDTEATVLEIQDTVTRALYENSSTSLSTTVSTVTEEPEVTSELLSSITDELGTFTTDYKSSAKNRKTNISVATAYLNGTVLMPGEQLSVSSTIKDRTEENGYVEAAQYSNGESETAIGGGVCQVSTTLYNAVIRAELQVDKRYNHSMVVHYVDYGDDAALAGNKKDLVFTNNLDNPIYIEGVATGKKLTFTIYGTEYRPENRTVEFEAKTISCEWPDKTVYNEKYTDELEEGKTKITGTWRPEVVATLTKVVYVDGVETERTLLHKDHYSASKKTKLIGTGKKS